MWVVREIKKGSRKIYQKKWKISNDTKFVFWVLACYVVIMTMLAVAWIESV